MAPDAAPGAAPRLQQPHSAGALQPLRRPQRRQPRAHHQHPPPAAGLHGARAASGATPDLRGRGELRQRHSPGSSPSGDVFVYLLIFIVFFSMCGYGFCSTQQGGAVQSRSRRLGGGTAVSWPHVPRSHPEPPVLAEEGLAPSISSLPQAGAAPGPQPPRVQMQLAC